MLTRRVHHRTFLLRPSKWCLQIMAYVLAVMQDKWNIDIHAVTVLSNHVHLCLTDPGGHIVSFQRDCHSFWARALNATHGEFESVWSSEATSRVECEEPDDMVRKIAYTMANPVESALVRYGKNWPGLRRAWPAKPLTIRRPKKFFAGEHWPEEATLTLVRPPGYEEFSDDDLAGLIQGAVFEREEEFRNQYDREGRKFMGRRAVLEQSRHARPKTREPRFGISPKVACRNKWRRIERLRADKQWQAAYRQSLVRWISGDRSVEFPSGTYQMRVVHDVRCADASLG